MARGKPKGIRCFVGQGEGNPEGGRGIQANGMASNINLSYIPILSSALAAESTQCLKDHSLFSFKPAATPTL